MVCNIWIHDAWCALSVLSLAVFELTDEVVKFVEKEYGKKLQSLISLVCPDKLGDVLKEN